MRDVKKYPPLCRDTFGAPVLEKRVGRISAMCRWCRERQLVWVCGDRDLDLAILTSSERAAAVCTHRRRRRAVARVPCHQRILSTATQQRALACALGGQRVGRSAVGGGSRHTAIRAAAHPTDDAAATAAAGARALLPAVGNVRYKDPNDPA